MDLQGAKYDAAIAGGVLRRANNTALGAADLIEGNAPLTFSDRQLTEDLAKAASLSSTNGVTKVPDPGDATFTLTITPAAGAINGTFLHTSDDLPNLTSFQWIIFQQGPNAGTYGFQDQGTCGDEHIGESGGVILIGTP